jgi:hypothetical protein
MLKSIRLILTDPLGLLQLGDERGPFFPQHVCSGQRSVSTTDGETIDPEGNQVLGGFESTFSGSDWVEREES